MFNIFPDGIFYGTLAYLMQSPIGSQEAHDLIAYTAPPPEKTAHHTTHTTHCTLQTVG